MSAVLFNVSKLMAVLCTYALLFAWKLIVIIDAYSYVHLYSTLRNYIQMEVYT